MLPCPSSLQLLTPSFSQGKLARSDFSPYLHGPSSGTSEDVFNPINSDSDIPLTITNPENTHYQQWDKQGKAVGYVGDPQVIHTPKPRAGGAAFLPSKLAKDVEEGMTRPLTTREDSTDSVEWDVDRRNTNNQSSIPVQPTFRNVHDSHHQGGFVPEMAQTPTQASFVNASPMHPNYQATPRSPFEEAYGGYENPYSHGHSHEPTDSTFRTAYSSSPVHDDDLASRSAHPGQQHGSAQASSPPTLGSMNLR